MELFAALRSTRSPILAFLGCVCAAFVIVCLVSTLHARDLAVEAAERESLDLAQCVAQATGDTIETSDGIVQEVVDLVESGGVAGGAGQRLRQVITRALGTIPRLHDLAVVDERGRIVVNGISTPDGRISIIATAKHTSTTMPTLVPSSISAFPHRTKVSTAGMSRSRAG